jgi:hypothetical protein
LASPGPLGRGTMLWFNGAKDVGAMRIDGGEKVEVPGGAFAAGEKPAGRCAGRAVEFVLLDGTLSEIAFVAEIDARRARLRSRR